jgi:hypothetical protein
MNAPVAFADRPWLGAVLRQVTKAPAGERLRIGDIARSLDLTQAQVIASIQTLVSEGRLDAQTLRPPVAGAVRKVPITATGPQVYRLLLEEGQRRGLSATATSFAVFGNNSQMTVMREAVRPVREGTRLKAERWLNSPWDGPAAGPNDETPATRSPASLVAGDCTPSAGSACEGAVQHAKAAAPSPSGIELAASIDALLAQHPTIVKAKLLARMGMGVTCLKQYASGARSPTPKVVARVAAFLADPQITDDMAKRPRPGRPRRPVTITYSSEDRSVGAARVFAAACRRQTAEAARILEANPDAKGGRNESITAAIAQLRRARDDEARRADPVEQAKLALRKRGRVVFDASVDGGRKGRFFVIGQVDDHGKRKQFTADELTAFAWKVNPRSMQEQTGKERL